jgi:P-type Cu2+ transporter
VSTAEALHARWSLDAGRHEHVVFVVEGMHCAGCARSIERAVGALPDVESVGVNVAMARVSVDWRGAGTTGLAQILAAVERSGFRPVPLAGEAASTRFNAERRSALKRVGFASLGMMQAMMYLGALYGASDIDVAMSTLMRVTGMAIVTPVLFYSGAPYLTGAWRDLANRRLGMDVPVALALLLAWLPSVVNVFRGSGEVYFDSVGMFIFFLSLGRYAEMSVRHRGLTSTEALARSLPAQVTRIGVDGVHERVNAAALRAGDHFLAPKGAVIAVDAVLDADTAPDGGALLDESLLTGESAAARRRGQDRIRGGSINVGAPLTLVALAAVGDSTLASMVRLLERAQTERPRLARAADRAASWFVAAILVLAAITAAAWMFVDPLRAFGAVLAVLVVTCPCALSLATPAALTAATSRLARFGVLITHADAVEKLARIDTVILDKTGTLTEAGGAVLDTRLFSSLDRASALSIAAALERGSAHPLATALRNHEVANVVATDVNEVVGQGIEGTIDGSRWRIGQRRFAESCADGNVHTLVPEDAGDATTWLGGPRGVAAAIDIGAPLRADARGAVDALRKLGLEVIIASGDGEAPVRQVARELGIERAHARCTPSRKIRLVRELRRKGRRVFAVGDGINDGPVLAAADVSCAMGTGSAIAQSAADLLLVHDGLEQLPRAIGVAREALAVMRQNLGWALAYNLAAVPLAAFGLISPWVAALGMSLSSLGVVLNARRLAGRFA